MSYQEEYARLTAELNDAKEEEDRASVIYSHAKARRKRLEGKAKKVKMLAEGARPFLLCKPHYSGGDMMGKGGTCDYDSEFGWSYQKRPTYSDKYRGEHEYTYAIELEDDEKSFKRIAYIGYGLPAKHFSIPDKKKLCDLPVDPNWDEFTRKAVGAWKKELADLRSLLA